MAPLQLRAMQGLNDKPHETTPIAYVVTVTLWKSNSCLQSILDKSFLGFTITGEQFSKSLPIERVQIWLASCGVAGMSSGIHGRLVAHLGKCDHNKTNDNTESPHARERLWVNFFNLLNKLANWGCV